MEISRGVYFFTFFLLGFIAITHSFALTIEETPDVGIPYHYNINSSLVSKANSPIETGPVTFDYLTSDGNSRGNFQVVQISKNAESITKFNIPKESNGPEYLTYALAPDFFIKYPRISAKASFYDNNGNFLWDKINRHYVQVMPNGQHILAISGDHSRFFIKDPDLKEIVDFEGMLVVDYKIIENRPGRQKGPDVCVAFLDGDVVFYDISASTKVRFKLNGNLKSIACDGENMAVLAHIERNQNNQIQDFLVYVKVKQVQSNEPYNAEIKEIFETALPEHYGHTLPIALYNNRASVLLPGEQSIKALIFDQKGKLVEEVNLPVQSEEPGDWRALSLPSAVVFWSSKDLLIFENTLIYRLHQDLINAKTRNNHLFLQTPQEIVSFEIK